MKIGIDASRAFLKNRTGIEEYSYQVIKNLTNSLQEEQVVLYIKKSQQSAVMSHQWPDNWKIKIIKWPRFWTQIGLSLEMLFNSVDTLFIPAHTVPVVHPKNTVVVIHGLEYEFCKDAYSFWERLYMRWTIKKSCQWASKIISVSENTNKDLINLYKVAEEKIEVIYEGYANSNASVISHQSSDDRLQIFGDKYFLFIGRIEQRKNIANVVEAFEKFREKTGLAHKLVLAGRPGYGWENIKVKISNSKLKDDIVELGYIKEEEKWELLKKADAFIFATLYEGFGIPILEAQSVGCPVIASDNSSIPEVVNGSAILVNPEDIDDICAKMIKLASDKEFKNDIVAKGFENIKRFSWEKCSDQISELIKK